jgi:hypothetical protein
MIGTFSAHVAADESPAPRVPGNVSSGFRAVQGWTAVSSKWHLKRVRGVFC